MSTYVLILVLATSNASGGLALTSVDFPSKQACEAAGKSAEKLHSWVTSSRFICVSKDGQS